MRSCRRKLATKGNLGGAKRSRVLAVIGCTAQSSGSSFLKSPRFTAEAQVVRRRFLCLNKNIICFFHLHFQAVSFLFLPVPSDLLRQLFWLLQFFVFYRILHNVLQQSFWQLPPSLFRHG